MPITRAKRQRDLEEQRERDVERLLNEAEEEEEEEARMERCKVCSVCYEPTTWSNFIDSKDKWRPNNAMVCPNGHATCMSCVRKIIKPSICSGNCACTGFAFECPLCRHRRSMTKVDLMVLLRGELDSLFDVFHNFTTFTRWQNTGWCAMGSPPAPEPPSP